MNPPDGTRQIKFTFYVNVQDGVLMVEFAKGPINPLPATTPQRLSDITFLAWQYFCKQAKPPVPLGSLKYVVHRMITNPSSMKILPQAAKNAGQSVKQYPGAALDPTKAEHEDPFRAVVGSPNGYGLGFFLAAHQDAFKGKVITAINVVNDEYGDLGAVFGIGDSPTKVKIREEVISNGAQPGSGSRSTLSTIPTKTESPRRNPKSSSYTADFQAYYDAEPAWVYGGATASGGEK